MWEKKDGGVALPEVVSVKCFLRAMSEANLIADGSSWVPARPETAFDFGNYRRRLVHVSLDSYCVSWMMSQQRQSMRRTGPYGTELQAAFEHYAQKGENPFIAGHYDLPLSVSQVVAEIQLTIDAMLSKRMILPAWLVLPKDQSLRRQANQLPYEFIDPGNMVFEAMFHLAGLSRLVAQSEEHMRNMMMLPAAPYADQTNKSSVGPVNRRGNLIEGMFHYLWRKSSQEWRTW